MRPNRHPGRSYIARFGSPQGIEEVLQYAGFLRHEAGLSNEPPVELEPIFEHFGMPPPVYAPLPDQQAILLSDETGLVLINEDDPATRQRFSQAHELMERLFTAHEESLHAGNPGVRFQDRVKEDLCEQGAAALLLPPSSLLPRLAGLGISLQAASTGYPHKVR